MNCAGPLTEARSRLAEVRTLCKETERMAVDLPTEHALVAILKQAEAIEILVDLVAKLAKEVPSR